MNKLKSINMKFSTLFCLCIILSTGCKRELSDQAEFATFPKVGAIFTDTPVGLGSNFYFPFGPGPDNPIGSKLDAFSVDGSVSYEGSASMRFDVPNATDPNGNYAGAIFRIDGSGRNLTEFDAMTFWAKASQAATISEFGFGVDFEENKYQVLSQNIELTTNWVKYTIPIPDPSKLVEERGMMTYSAAPINGLGYSFWIDELKFEKLGTVAQPRPAIFDGEDRIEETFIGNSYTISGLTQTFNLESGLNQTVSAAPAYYTFRSSNPEVASVNQYGFISVISAGSTEITALLGNVKAQGSMKIESVGEFVSAPTPTEAASDVISIFSDAYTNVPVDFYNGYYEPFQLTEGQDDLIINGNNIIKYTKLNFVGIEFKNPTIDASEMTHLHIDIQIEKSTILDEDFIRIEVADFGPGGTFGGGDDSSGSVTITSADLVGGSWISLDIPLSNFSLTSLNNLGQLVFVTDGSATDFPGTITDILVDNIYLYK